MADGKKGRGCFFYGCLTMAVVAIVGVIATFFVVRYAYKAALAKFTSPTPVAVAPVRLNARDGDQAVQRLENFTRSLQTNKAGAAPLEISSDELDYIVRHSKGGLQIRDAIHLSVTNGQIHGQLSLPLSLIRPEFSGRYFNGDATFSVSMQGGALVVAPSSVEVNGQKLPEQVVAQFAAQQNLRWPPAPGAEGSALITNLSKIEIKDDKIVLHP